MPMSCSLFYLIYTVLEKTNKQNKTLHFSQLFTASRSLPHPENSPHSFSTNIYRAAIIMTDVVLLIIQISTKGTYTRKQHYQPIANGAGILYGCCYGPCHLLMGLGKLQMMACTWPKTWVSDTHMGVTGLAHCWIEAILEMSQRMEEHCVSKQMNQSLKIKFKKILKIRQNLFPHRNYT